MPEKQHVHIWMLTGYGRRDGKPGQLCKCVKKGCTAKSWDLKKVWAA